MAVTRSQTEESREPTASVCDQRAAKAPRPRSAKRKATRSSQLEKQKRARCDGDITAMRLPAQTHDEADKTSVENTQPSDSERHAKILHNASARLVWSRIDEFEALQLGLRDLGRALEQAEEIRRRIETNVTKDLASAMQVAAVRMPGEERTKYDQPFSKFFYALIGHLIPTPRP